MKPIDLIVNSPTAAHPYQGTATNLWYYERSHNHSKFLLPDVSWNSCKNMALLANVLHIFSKLGSNESLLATTMPNSLTVSSLFMMLLPTLHVPYYQLLT